MLYILVFIVAYLIGSVNFSIILSKKFAGYDIRTKGSNSAGTTNVLRNMGKLSALIVLILDILKGVISVLIALVCAKLAKDANGAYLVQFAGLGAVIGHCFPLYYGFKGGKGVATSLGVLLILNWKIGLICLIFAIAIMALTRLVSLGSISAAILYPILTLFIRTNYLVNNGTSYFLFSLVLAALVIYKHRENIIRIFNGNENRLSFSKSEKVEDTKE